MNLINTILIYIIKIYQTAISPILGNNCRYYPSCSSYCVDSLKKYNTIYAAYISIKRIVRCNPFGGSGYDPIP